MQFAEAIPSPLLKPVLRGQSFMLRFEDRERNRFSSFCYGATKQIIGAASRSPITFASHDVDLGRGLLHTNILASPAAMIDQYWID